MTSKPSSNTLSVTNCKPKLLSQQQRKRKEEKRRRERRRRRREEKYKKSLLYVYQLSFQLVKRFITKKSTKLRNLPEVAKLSEKILISPIKLVIEFQIHTNSLTSQKLDCPTRTCRVISVAPKKGVNEPVSKYGGLRRATQKGRLEGPAPRSRGIRLVHTTYFNSHNELFIHTNTYQNQ